MAMNATELTDYVAAFLETCRAAEYRYNEAVAEEARPNEATQDLLHLAELAPWKLDDVDIVGKLHDLRIGRRTAKLELEVTTIWKKWCDQNKNSLNQLQQTLGEMRKVLRRQPNYMYRFRTDVFGEKDSWLQQEDPPVKEDPDAPDPNQVTIEEVMEGNKNEAD